MQSGTIYCGVVQTSAGVAHKKWGLGMFSIHGPLLLTVLSPWTLLGRGLQVCPERAEGVCQQSPGPQEPQRQALCVSWNASRGDQ